MAMNRTLLLVLLGALLSTSPLVAQTCQRDSNLLLTKQLLSPAPYSPDSPYYNLKEACIDEPYNQSVTVFVPDTFVYLGFKVPIQSVSIATTNAIQNYPAGMTYLCDPPNCVFQSLSLGCILLNGTPSSSNQPDTFDLGIAVKVKTPLGEVPLVLPRDIDTSYHYYLILKEKGSCNVSTDALEGLFSAIQLMPNPAADRVVMAVHSAQSIAVQLEIVDLSGRVVQQRQMWIAEGESRFEIDTAPLASGTYFIVLHTEQGRAVRRLARM